MSTDWCMEERCRHRHWRSGSMPTHRRGDDCPPESRPVTGMGDCTWWLGSDKCFLDEGHEGDHHAKWASQFVTIVFREGGTGVRQWPPATTRYPDRDPCVMRPDRPHVCLNPDHDERHGRPNRSETP